MFATHPATQERLDDVRAAAAAIAGSAARTRNAAQYRAATRPFLENWLDAELAQRRYASSMLVISELLDDAPPEDRGVLTFYLGEAYRRRDAAGDRAKAADLYARAIALPGAPAGGVARTRLRARAVGPQRRGARSRLQPLSATTHRRPTIAPSCNANSTNSEARRDARCV